MRPTVRAPGKAMLIGEYAVLDGGPAVVAAVTCYAVATLSATEGPASAFVARALHHGRAALLDQGVALPEGVPVVDTSAFAKNGAKLGLGSSAACTVAAVGALFAGADLDPAASRAAIQRIAGLAHDEAQGVRGSGADILAATWGGIRVLNASPATMPLPAHLVFVATSRSASTSELVARYHEVGAPARTAARSMADAALRFLAAWQGGDGPALLGAVEEAFEGYLSLGEVLAQPLITEEHAAIARAARLAGGAAKPSGAGGGDLAVIFLPNEEAGARFRAALPSALHPLSITVSAKGVHLLLENVIR